MKYIFKSATIAIALLACSTYALAQGYDPEHPTATGVNVVKNVTGPDANQNYTITLETFAEGTTAVTYSSVPSDIILVLDTSSSMRDNNYPAGNNNPRRINALKSAVREFVANIYDNAMACRELDPNYVNRIAIVTYNRNANMVQSWVDVTTVVTKNGNTYSGALMDKIGTNNNNGFTCGSGTRPDHGLDMVINELLDGTPSSARAEANLTVLLFTDGYPTDNNATQLGDPANTSSQQQFEQPFANKTLYYGSQIKNNYGATVYTVGLIDEVASTSQWYRNYRRVLTLMDWLSSNYTGGAWSSEAVNENTTIPIESAGGTYMNEDIYYSGYNGTGTVLKRDNVPLPWRNDWTISGNTISVDGYDPGTLVTGDDVPPDGYFLRVGNGNFTSIFQSISSASGGSASAADATSQVRDVVSNSFVLPENFSANSVTITTMDIKSDASGWENEQPATGVTTVIKDVTGSDGEVRKELIVEGFDFSKDDVYVGNGFTVTPGNWVGKRYTNPDNINEWRYYGKKLVIKFNIKPNGEATGGDGTNTNHPDSGVYLLVKDDNGNPILDENGEKQYNKVTSYPVPHTNLPLIIKITKDGLLHGESATFEVHRTRPKGWNEAGATLEEKMKNVEYNALGKPMPDLEWKEDPNDADEDPGWHNWSKVILTNKGEDFAEVVKVLYALDPAYVYEVTEDDWGWSYTLTGTSSALNTSEVEVNPFNFHNQLKTGVVKHAEAVTINHFQGSETAAREEHYKSIGNDGSQSSSK